MSQVAALALCVAAGGFESIRVYLGCQYRYPMILFICDEFGNNFYAPVAPNVGSFVGTPFGGQIISCCLRARTGT
jgi:hypothetical protein